MLQYQWPIFIFFTPTILNELFLIKIFVDCKVIKKSHLFYVQKWSLPDQFVHQVNVSCRFCACSAYKIISTKNVKRQKMIYLKEKKNKSWPIIRKKFTAWHIHLLQCNELYAESKKRKLCGTRNNQLEIFVIHKGFWPLYLNFMEEMWFMHTSLEGKS